MFKFFHCFYFYFLVTNDLFHSHDCTYIDTLKYLRYLQNSIFTVVTNKILEISTKQYMHYLQYGNYTTTDDVAVPLFLQRNLSFSIFFSSFLYFILLSSKYTDLLIKTIDLINT